MKMKGMSNKVISVLIIFLWITALIWNVYSYLCMGVSHEYDIYGIVTTQNSRDMLNVMWKTFSMSVIINSSLIFLAFFEMLLKNNKDRRRWFFIISLMSSALSVVIWEINYRNLLMTLTDSGDITVNILKRGYYTYIIVIMIITGILLLLEERNAHCRISGNT